MIYVRLGIYYAMYAYLIIIGISILLSWFPRLQEFAIFRFIRYCSDAYMGPFHGIIVIGMFDFTTIFGIIFLELLIRLYVYLAF